MAMLHRTDCHVWMRRAIHVSIFRLDRQRFPTSDPSSMKKNSELVDYLKNALRHDVFRFPNRRSPRLRWAE
jgi:hypothetical protein